MWEINVNNVAMQWMDDVDRREPFYLLPPQSQLISSAPLRYAVASLLVFSPILLANPIFSRLFKESVDPDIGFASNLLGAVFGGLLEHLSLSFGYQFLILVVACLYGLAFAFGSLGRAAQPAPADLVEAG